MKQCSGYGWKHIFSLKEGLQKNITKDHKDLEADMKHERKGLCSERGIGRCYNGVEKLTEKTEVFYVFEYEYEQEKKGGQEKVTKTQVHFMWETNLKLTERNLEEFIRTGRKRWKIENEGFNNQKNGIYKIEHLNSRDTNAMKNHYLLTQVRTS